MHEQFKRLVTVFGVPNRPDPEAFIREFCQAVGTMWPDGVLERAVTRLIAEHAEPFWPMPARLKAICREECPRSPIENGPRDDRPELTDEQIAEQERVMREHRRRMIDQKLDEVDWSQLPDVSRDAFEGMMANSSNHHLHRKVWP